MGDTVTKWRVRMGRFVQWNEPMAVTFARETDAFLVDENGRRHAKVSEYNCYYDSAVEAAAALRDKLQSKVDAAKARLQSARSALGEADAYLKRFNMEAPHG